MVNTNTAARQSDDGLMSVADVARYLNVSTSTVRDFIARGEIPFHRIRTLIRFRRSEVDAWLEATRIGEGAA
jgi:excisionase family DNA binding protein